MKRMLAERMPEAMVESVTGSARSRMAPNFAWGATPAEAGMFAGITSIQRVNTFGGAVPAQACDTDHAGAESRVPFSADYYFYRRRGGG